MKTAQALARGRFPGGNPTVAGAGRDQTSIGRVGHDLKTLLLASQAAKFLAGDCTPNAEDGTGHHAGLAVRGEGEGSDRSRTNKLALELFARGGIPEAQRAVLAASGHPQAIARESGGADAAMMSRVRQAR